MSTSGSPFDPRQPRYAPDDSMTDADLPPRQRPGALTAVCVIAIVLGALGLCMSLVGLGSLAFQSNLEKLTMQQAPPGMPEGALKSQMEMQKKMQEKMMEVNHRYWVPNVGLTILNLIFASSLLAGGIMTLKLNPTARTFLVGVFATVIVFEIVCAVVTVFMQLDMAAAMSEAMSQMMTTVAPKGGPAADQTTAFVVTATKIGAYVGMAFSLCVGLGKMIFYGIGACYLRRPKIRELFETATTDRI